tara:strand:- start:1173 stop:1676 length:504 start_codon:yes stop_codon:yes gene_type:complete
MLKVGGRVIHMLPSSNWVDHGFYMFSPTIFHDYYSANNWAIETARIIELTRRHNIDPWRIYNYEPGILNPLSSGGFDKGYLVNIFFVVTKTNKSVCSQIPQQSRYQMGKWNTASQNDSSSKFQNNLKQRLSVVINWMKSIPLFYSIFMSITYFFLRKKRMPPLIAKY